jgi:hypothetical protein
MEMVWLKNNSFTVRLWSEIDLADGYVVNVRYHSGGSMKLNACNLLLAHMVYL